jgi:hypothetical protein
MRTIDKPSQHTTFTRRRTFCLLPGALWSVHGTLAFADDDLASTVRAQLALVNSQSDYLQGKLALDALIGGSTNEEATLLAVDRLVLGARDLAGAHPDDARKLAAVRMVIYQASVWNENRPFAYDMRDPLGRNLQSKLLATFVSTRLGNCVSMPILFLIVADRLGLNVGLATAPHHVFVRYTPPDGRAINLETTSGGHPARDVWYREHMPMTDLALSNGLYMRTLSRREGVATMALIVAEYLFGIGLHGEAISVCEAIGEHNPRDVQPLLIAAASYGRMFTQEFEERYPTIESIPRELHGRYRMLAEMNSTLFARAEALGWQPRE